MCVLCYYLVSIVVTSCVMLYCVCITILDTSVAGLLAWSRYPEGPATGHLGTGFSCFPCVYKQMLRWFPRLQVATACFSCSSPDLNFLVTYFIFMYMHNNHCHRVTAQLQLINIIIIKTRNISILEKCKQVFISRWLMHSITWLMIMF